MDIIIHAKPETVEHKLEGNCEGCWWDFRHGPKKIRVGIDHIYFANKDGVHAVGDIEDQDCNRVYMFPLKKVSLPLPCKLPGQGFKYIKEENAKD